MDGLIECPPQFSWYRNKNINKYYQWVTCWYALTIWLIKVQTAGKNSFYFEHELSYFSVSLIKIKKRIKYMNPRHWPGIFSPNVKKNTDLWLVMADHVTWTLASDWPVEKKFTLHQTSGVSPEPARVAVEQHFARLAVEQYFPSNQHNNQWARVRDRVL